MTAHVCGSLRNSAQGVRLGELGRRRHSYVLVAGEQPATVQLN